MRLSGPCLTALFSLVLLVANAAQAAPRTVRVGVYENPPKLLADAQGQPSGILGDLLREVARLEDWTLEPVPCEWERCLQLLEDGELDLMPDVAWSEARATRFDFHRIPALPSWSQLYRRSDVTLQSVLDLEGKRLVVLEGSVQQAHLAGLLSGFGLRAELVPVKSFEDAFAMVAAGAADAVAANRYSGDGAASRHGLSATSLVFLPSQLYFATDKGRNADLLATIDTRLDAWVADAGSFYYRTLARWGQEATQPRVPVAFWWGLAAVLGLLVLALGFVALLRREVARQTLALRESEERLRLALAAAHQGLYDLDLTTGEVQVSPEYATMLGYDPRTFRESLAMWRERLHPDDQAAVNDTFEAYVSDRLPEYRVEFRLRTRLGDWKWILSLGRIQARAPDGRPLRMLGTHTDIDAIKAAESALRELNAHLEARVAERTAELTAANHELETFAYAVSHDLRAPLRAMSGFSHALLEDHADALPGDARAYVQQIITAGRKMSDLVEGLLALSRVTRGELRMDRVDVSALAQQHLAELAASDPSRTVAVEVEPGLSVQGDQRMIASVLDNLLDNAWKYTGTTAQPTIRVQGCTADGMSGFCVTDNGAGFDMAHAARLFQAFQRLHRQDEFPGIGIGLATVQRIVRRHGGQITAQGTTGQGATFSVLLPPRAGSTQESTTT